MKHFVLKLGFLLVGFHSNSQTLAIKNLGEDNTIYTEEIFWDISSAVLHKSSEEYLNQLIPILRDNEKLNISFTLYEVQKLDHSFNFLNKRVESIIQYLSDQGLEPSRISGKGYNFIEKENWDAFPQRFVVVKFYHKNE